MTRNYVCNVQPESESGETPLGLPRMWSDQVVANATPTATPPELPESGRAGRSTYEEARRLEILANMIGELSEDLVDSDHQELRYKAQLMQEHAYELQQQSKRIAGLMANATPEDRYYVGGEPDAGAETPLGLPKCEW